VQLAKYGLKLVEIQADGNCLFRAIADQLLGDQHKHSDLRVKTVEYIEENKDLYKFFIEDDESIEDYVNWIRQDSKWAG